MDPINYSALAMLIESNWVNSSNSAVARKTLRTPWPP